MIGQKGTKLDTAFVICLIFYGFFTIWMLLAYFTENIPMARFSICGVIVACMGAMILVSYDLVTDN